MSESKTMSDGSDVFGRCEALAEAVIAAVIDWRRDIHAHPELGTQEVRTAGLVADHLRAIGFDEIRTGLAGGTGVVGVLRGRRPGPVVALRADMDALPVREETGLPFASRATAPWGEQTVPVMHACGHDAHTAILMGAAQVLAQVRDELHGTVVAIFQPAEEGPPPGWKGPCGAALMVEEGVLDDPRPDAIFGLHVDAHAPPGSAGRLTYHVGAGTYAMSVFRIVLHGRGGHASTPWLCVDPIVAAGQVIMGLQTIPSRNVDVNNNHVSLSLGVVRGGEKFNVIPEAVELEGALRFTDPGSRGMLEQRLVEVAEAMARGTGAAARVDWVMRVPVLYNDPALAQAHRASLAKAAGSDASVMQVGSFFLDDFSCFLERVPGLFIGLSVAPDMDDRTSWGGHHAPNFYVNERALGVGVKAMLNMTLDFMQHSGSEAPR